ncbi:MAG: rhodanese-like domain-containing protein [Bacilli bacterium]|nr:rhodanese-like domain-containing protein [Bacilli bacterium]
MKKIKLRDYNSNMGIFIDVNYNDSKIVDNSLHIQYDNLLINHKELIDKSKKYYIYCNGGVKSRKVVSMLEFYGYDVTLVEK